ncbi:hypothetical protein B273_0372 [SAR86 cluster bacterium SAR86E]|uniref:Uncharacterized protein n=1 Tax=SAR86 cluster bacterium SAR86E TaxID=1208365 RepID=K6G7Q4_9GAMM|nr:hypothetical protein B273_0372 [SAR86 cluster bacterium SAR86E]
MIAFFNISATYFMYLFVEILSNNFYLFTIKKFTQKLNF